MSALPASARTRTSRSLVHGLGLLRLFSGEQPVRSVAELADLMGVSRPTAHRYASTCLELGYLEQAPMRRYRLTRKSAHVGEAMLGSLALTQKAGPILRELRQATGHTVSLAVLDGPEAVYLQRLCGSARGQYELEEGLGAGSRRPARHTAAGKALLALLSAQESDDTRWIHQSGLALQSGLAFDGPGRRVDARKGALRARARALAVAVWPEGERPSAIEITVPAETMSAAEMIASLGKRLTMAGASLQAALGESSASEGVVDLAN